MTTPKVPEDFYNSKSLKTLGGSAGAVWLILLVVANLDAEHKLIGVTGYKFISLLLSQFFAIFLLLRDRRKTRKENYLFAFLNGLLIFVNASGINAITSQASSNFPTSSAATIEQVQGDQTASALFLPIFKNEVNWWKNPKEQVFYQELRQDNMELKDETQQLEVENTMLETQKAELQTEKVRLQTEKAEIQTNYDNYKVETQREILKYEATIQVYKQRVNIPPQQMEQLILQQNAVINNGGTIINNGGAVLNNGGN